MKLNLNSNVKSVILTSFSTLAVITQLSCAASKNAGVNLGVSVSPQKAYVVPGKGVSCVAQAAAKVDGTAPTADIEGDRVLFNKFALQWRSGDKLTIASIKATIFSTGITGAETTDGLEVTLDEAEIAALLGIKSLSIDFASPYREDQVTNVDSTDTSIKTSTNPYAPCGFQIGGLTSVKGVKNYNARIRIEVSGFATKCSLKDGVCEDGEQSPVRQTVTVSAQKF